MATDAAAVFIPCRTPETLGLHGEQMLTVAWVIIRVAGTGALTALAMRSQQQIGHRPVVAHRIPWHVDSYLICGQSGDML